jgi:hypothetical protein
MGSREWTDRVAVSVFAVAFGQRCVQRNICILQSEHFIWSRTLCETLHVTPAMEAGVSDHVWSIDEIIALLQFHSMDDLKSISG